MEYEFEILTRRLSLSWGGKAFASVLKIILVVLVMCNIYWILPFIYRLGFRLSNFMCFPKICDAANQLKKYKIKNVEYRIVEISTNKRMPFVSFCIWFDFPFSTLIVFNELWFSLCVFYLCLNCATNILSNLVLF